MARKILGGLVLAFVLFYAVTNPVSTGHFIRALFSGLGTIASTAASDGGR